MRFILRLSINALGLLLVAYLIPGISVSSFWAALVFALILGFLNAIIRPLLIILTLPINILTLGLFTLIINALVFWFASSIAFGVEISTFASAFWGALIMWVISWFTSSLLKKEKGN